jgi:hypothetical protein
VRQREGAQRESTGVSSRLRLTWIIGRPDVEVAAILIVELKNIGVFGVGNVVWLRWR